MGVMQDFDCPIRAEGSLWFKRSLDKWTIHDGESSLAGCGTQCGQVRTLRAFKRHIKKHSYLPAGTILRLCNRYIGYDVSYVFK